MGQPRQQKIIPFVNDQKSGLSDLNGASPAAINVIVKGGSLKRRPGIGAFSGATSAVVNSSGITGLHTTLGGTLYAIGGASPGRAIYKVTAGGSTSISTASETDLRGTGRPVFAETQPILAIAAGDRVQKILLSSSVSSPLATAPKGKFVVYISKRLLLIDPDIAGQVDYSQAQVGGALFSSYEDWTQVADHGGFFNAQAKADPVVSMAENTNEVFVFGTTSLQVFTPQDSDPVFPFLPSTTREVGCSAPYSVVRNDQQFAWLDNLRRFVVSDGRSFTPISDGIQQELNDMSRVDDCFGYRFIEGSVDAVVWCFPTDGRTLSYQNGFGWSEWMLWDSVSNNFTQYPVTAHHIDPNSGRNVVGTGDGHIYELSNRQLSDAGSAIRASVTTGFIDRDTDSRKQCHAIRLSIRRGQTTGSEPVALLSWRDDLGPFGPPIEVGFGEPGDLETVVEFRGNGVYRRRQWKFVFTGSDDLELASASEEFEVLNS